MALDTVHPHLVTSMNAASETAPSNPTVGMRWYRASTGVTYQYTNDGTSSFWLDVSTGGIGTTAARKVSYVGDVDPLPTHNGGSGTLLVGQVYYNREGNRYFVCTDATNDANVWKGRFAGSGGIETYYTSGSNHYRIHTFLGDGTFYVDSTITTADLLIVGGGGSGGWAHTTGANSSERGGGGGAGGMLVRVADTLSVGTYNVVVGDGGEYRNRSQAGNCSDWGDDSSLIKNDSTIVYKAMGGGKGTHQGSRADQYPVAYDAASQNAMQSGIDQYQGGAGGSGGGAHGNSGGNGGLAKNYVNGLRVHGGSLGDLTVTQTTTADQEGYYGGNGATVAASSYQGGGGGGAGGHGSSGTGGAGCNNTFRTGSNVLYAKGADYGPSSGFSGNTTSNDGFGGRGGFEEVGPADGNAGIVVIRYKTNN